MRKNKNAGLLLLLLAVVGGYCGYRLIRHEQNQNAQIYALQQQIALLSEKGKDSSDASLFKENQGYHYLAVGNSITLHGLADYWWGEWGMVASTKESDYVNRIVSALENEMRDEEIVNAAYNYSVWEVQSHDRAQTWEFLDQYLFPGIDLITVQLSENCSDLTTFQSDFAALLDHIMEKCGADVLLIVIDDFWSDEKSEIKRTVCEDMGITFVDLSDIRGKAQYQAGLGTTVYSDEGKANLIEHEGVASHPGDFGMEVIAQRVFEKVWNEDGEESYP